MWDVLITASLGTILIVALMVFIIGPLQYGMASFWATAAQWHFGWERRISAVRTGSGRRRSKREFLRWLEDRAGTGHLGGGVDDDVVCAQRLTPLIRILLSSEIPDAIRRCNGIHRRMALVSGAHDMHEIAFEPECVASRDWIATVLFNANELLMEYPLRFRIEADELVNASMVVRNSLLPTCSDCPYIKKSVIEAGPRCPAAAFIQSEPKERPGEQA